MKRFLLALVVVAALFGGSFFLFAEDDGYFAQDDATAGEEAAPVAMGQDASAAAPAESSFDRGVRAKQREFESKDPEFPNEEKIVYALYPDGTSDPELHPADAELLDLIRSLAPSQAIFESIVELEVYYDESDDALAAVQSLDDENKTWLYSVNYTAVDNFTELAPTIVHEFAHILALNDPQTVTEVEDPRIREACRTYLVDEGCLTASSYLNSYYEQFWKGTPAFQEQDRSADEALAFFEANPEDYVSDYATTNPIEDFAESFMFYVVEEPLPPTTLKGRKVAFFDSIASVHSYRSKVLDVVHVWGQ